MKYSFILPFNNDDNKKEKNNIDEQLKYPISNNIDLNNITENSNKKRKLNDESKNILSCNLLLIY